MAKLRPKSFPYTRGGEDLANDAAKRVRSVASQRRANTREGAFKNYSATKNSYPDRVRPVEGNVKGNPKVKPEGTSSFPDYAGITNEQQGHRASVSMGSNIPGYGQTNFKTPGVAKINTPGGINSGGGQPNNNRLNPMHPGPNQDRNKWGGTRKNWHDPFSVDPATRGGNSQNMEDEMELDPYGEGLDKSSIGNDDSLDRKRRHRRRRAVGKERKSWDPA